MIEKNTFNNSINFNGAKGLVYIGNEILVYRRDNNTNSEPLKLDLPGGGRDGNESAFETFSREVMEEFGLEIKNGKFYDTGNKLEYIKTVVDFALKHEDIKDDFSDYLKTLFD